MGRKRTLLGLTALAGLALTGARPAAAAQVVFVSSTVQDGNFGGLAGGDAICSDLARSAGLDGKWKAWLSTAEIDAADRIPGNGPFLRVDGTQIAADRASLLAGNLDNPVRLTETGMVASSSLVFTGTTFDGTNSGFTCNDWSSNSGADSGTTGQVSLPTVAWTDAFEVPCDLRAQIYCFQVPELLPAPLLSSWPLQALALVVLPLLGLAGLRRRT